MSTLVGWGSPVHKPRVTLWVGGGSPVHEAGIAHRCHLGTTCRTRPWGHTARRRTDADLRFHRTIHNPHPLLLSLRDISICSVQVRQEGQL